MATYYVATTGSDSGNGSASSPFRTIDRALNVSLTAGDTVVVKPGTYNEAIMMDRGGSAAGYVTIKSEVPGAALIRPPASQWNALSVTANYVVVDGFDIRGNNGDGIEVNGRHHVKILNNIVHDAGESGIQFNQSEFITIEGNTTFNNASDGWFSGISIYQTRNITGDTGTTGFRTIVRNNTSYDNVTYSGQHTDGNGIIIDDFQSTQTGGYPNYTYATLVENNLVYNNGGKGIAVHWSDNVTVRNNTAYHNNLDLANGGTWRGELSNQDSNNTVWVNNIAVASPGVDSDNTAIGNYSTGGANVSVVWKNNLTFNGTAGQVSLKLDGGNGAPTVVNGNLLGMDPRFVNAGVDFNLVPISPGINAGSNVYGLAVSDLDGGPRVVGIVDLGAYESGGTSPPGAVDAVDDTGTTTQNSSVTISVLANDKLTGTGPLRVQSVDLGGTLGTASVNSAGAIVYTPNGKFNHLGAGESATDTLAYTLGNGAGATDRATVRVTVTGINEAPDAINDSNLRVAPHTSVRLFQGPLLANDRDADGDGLKVIAVDSAQNGSVQISATGRITFTSGEVGPASFRYTVSDSHGGTDAATVSLTVGSGSSGREIATGLFLTEPIRIDGDGVVRGTSGDDLLLGGNGADVLFGKEGTDTLNGRAGNDRLFGGSGESILVGGRGDDAFVIPAAHDRARPALEIRAGDGAGAFEHIGRAGGDVLDLRTLDADTTEHGQQHFTLADLAIGNAGGDTIIRGDTDGDDIADFVVRIVDGDVAAAHYKAADFLF